MTVIVGVSASIAAYKACEVIRRLKKKGHDVIPVATKDALNFVTLLTLESLSGNRAYSDMFGVPEKRDTVHISLAKKADLIIIAPASCDIIAKMATGICDELLTSVVISSKAPVLIAPAMNTNMFNSPVTKGNIAKLKKVGYEFVGPVKGELSCGDTGIGHLADVTEIIKSAQKILK